MKPQTMRTVRQFHFYVGVFFAPLIMLFAVSGALQTFRLQEEKGWGGTPPAWIEAIATIHKDSKLPRVAPANAGPVQAEPPHDGEVKRPDRPKPPQVNKLPMQVLVVAMSVGLFLSALLGVVIALNTRSTRRLAMVMLLAGTVLPIVLLKLA